MFVRGNGVPLGRLLKPRVAAERLDISTKTLRRMRRDRRIPYTEISPGVYRYPEKVLEKWIRERTQKVLM